jgi:hypothetical protein
VNEEPTPVFQDFGFMPKAEIGSASSTRAAFIATLFLGLDGFFLGCAGRNPLAERSLIEVRGGASAEYGNGKKQKEGCYSWFHEIQNLIAVMWPAGSGNQQQQYEKNSKEKQDNVSDRVTGDIPPNSFGEHCCDQLKYHKRRNQNNRSDENPNNVLKDVYGG